MKRFTLCHIGKGNKISIQTSELRYQYYILSYEVKNTNTYSMESPLGWCYQAEPKNPLFLLELIRHMVEKQNSIYAVDIFQVKSLFYQFLSNVLQELTEITAIRGRGRIVNQAVEYINKRYGEAITIKDIMEGIGISSTHLNRLFKQQTGKSPQEYLVMLRLANARTRLLGTNNNIQEIARSSGYTDEYQFSRIFKKYVGVSPARYRKLLGINEMLAQREYSLEPKRVAVQYLIGDVLALGVVPVGISEIYEGAVFEDLLQDSTVLGHQSKWDMEQLKALKPDIIICIVKEEYKEYSKIAPTLYVPHEELTKEETILLLGAALNKRQEAAAVVKEYRKKVEEAKQKLKQAGIYRSTFANIEGGLRKVSVIGNRFGCGYTLYHELSLKAGDYIQKNIIDKDACAQQVDFEKLPAYCGDYIIRNRYQGMDDFSSDQLWNSLRATQTNQVVEMEFGLNYYSDILSTKAQIDYIVTRLLSEERTAG